MLDEGSLQSWMILVNDWISSSANAIASSPRMPTTLRAGLISAMVQRRRKSSGEITASSARLPFHFEKLEPEWAADSENQFPKYLQGASRLSGNGISIGKKLRGYIFRMGIFKDQVQWWTVAITRPG